ncbi:MAG: hypothetical protein WD042_07030 [Phycisphaeraceae bacterium]
MNDRVAQLVVFSDDWGRHPSSCQHLVARLLPRYSTVWVNTIGTRMPGLSGDDLRKVAAKLRQWSRRRPGAGAATPSGDMPANLTVVSPRMFPGFRRSWQRRLNASAMRKAVHEALGPRRDGVDRIAITTLPLTADLVGSLEVDRWVYYCVDDFSAWPGLDSGVMQAMEAQQAGKVDRVIAVSDVLCDRLTGMGAKPSLLTHGIDLAHWRSPEFAQTAKAGQPSLSPSASATQPLPDWCAAAKRPIFLFWGLLDRRLDAAWCAALVEANPGTLVLLGPRQELDPPLVELLEKDDGRVIAPGPAGYDQLPALAAWADVLVMPYADLPVTRAMQPLKFKEYLAAGWPKHGKPVVVRALPATADWADAADGVDTADTFAAMVKERLATGLPDSQRQARQRLEEETWDRKAMEFESLIMLTTRSGNTDEHG